MVGGRIVLPALGTKTQRMGGRMAEVIPGSSLLPSPEQWAAWHGNVITPFRKSGATRQGFLDLGMPLLRTIWHFFGSRRDGANNEFPDPHVQGMCA